MKKTLRVLSILSLFTLLILPTKARAVEVLLADLTLSTNCAGEANPEDFYWVQEWNDEIPSRFDGSISNESFYKLEAPCKVFLGDTFEVRITATDTNCNTYSFGATIADTWSLVDTVLSGPPVATTVDSGSFWSNDINVYPSGTWEKSYIRPTPSADNHTIEFSAKDLGHCTGGHIWTTGVAGETVVDPVRGASNSAPQANPAGEGVYELGSDFRLGGTVSDADGDEVSYLWTDNGNAIASGTVQTAQDGSDVALQPTLIRGGFSLGLHTVTIIVSDGKDSSESSIEVEFVDTIAPRLRPSSDTATLWPPNNDMVPVVINANAVDNSGDIESITVSVSSSGGDAVIEKVDVDTQTANLLLKASSKNGVVYTVTVEAEDASGNTASADISIPVAHQSPDRRDFGKGHKK
jgi:hypothetical protein